ncbi:outer membrane beta-barrel family protein [Flavobacterium psychrophilum]|uniref:outer membrane beta-barrel family protein n=1 Tax=Flavobacterium psychrophilum TaxID=96345 RepID=UPI001C8F4BDB|nr:outer membrane beta-barrel family protein [Flavobacterium psychrophilum]QZK98524.1 TonB-dependent receptor [Flavobacterium psychrophilum]
MSKIYFILFFLFFIFPSKLFSQVTISGQIKDKKNKPIEFLEIQLQNNDSIIVKSELTNVDGKFTILTEKGEYQLIIKQLGKVLQKQKITAKQDTYIGVIQIIETQQQLEEVIIASKKKLIERKVDRLIFNIENSISASGGDAIDALKITPNIRVQNEAINMIGKNGMSVMIDDRIIQLSGADLINFLKTIKSDDIKNIEVITNPPAKYDAEGNSGLINIKLKKAKLDSWNATLNSTYKQTTYPTSSNGGSFNYQKKKLSFFSNINYVNGSKKGIEEEKIIYTNQTWNNEFKRKIYSNTLSGRFGFDYNIKDKWTIGAQYLGSLNKPQTNQNDNSTISNNNTQNIDSLIISKSFDYKKIKSNSINLHSLVKIDSLGKTISFDADYFNYDNTINRNFNTQNTLSDNSLTINGYKSAENFGTQKMNIYSGKVDLVNPLKWVKLTYGGKIYFSKTDYNNNYFDTKTGTPIFQANQSNNFIYNENTQALYLSGNKKLSDKWEIQIGLRLENTQIKGNSITLNQVNTNNYLQFFPTTYIQYTASENNSFSLNYGKRLSRPRFNELNPFKVYYNPYSYTQGNPFLVPSYSNNIELQHSYKDMLVTVLSFSNTTNGIGNPPFFDESTKVQYLLDLNYYTNNTYNLSETYIFSKYKWWESENQVNVYYNTTKVTKDINLNNTKGFGAYFSTNNNFILNKNKTLKGEINFWYQAPQYEDIYKKQSASGFDLGVKYSMLNNNLQLAVIAQDIFRGDIDRAKTSSNNIHYSYLDYNDSRFFRISLTYKFGSQKINLKQRNLSNEEEKRRIDN